jgi:hypothetical protein
MITVAPSELAWLQAFFGEANELKWQALADGSARPDWAAQVLPWLHFLDGESPNGAFVLPVFQDGEVACWYGLAASDRSLTQLAEELLAWIGPSYSDYSGGLHELSEADPVQCAIRNRFGPLAVRLFATSNTDRAAIQALLAQYHSVIRRRPPTSERGQRPFGRIRGDFDRALLAGNELNARRFLDEMVGSGRVSAEQRKCLDIRLLAGLGRFEQLARDHGLLHSIADISLPPQTLLDAVESLYKTYIEPVESLDLESIRGAFLRHIARPYGPLFRERKGLRHPQVITAFLLSESLRESPDLVRAESLLRAYPEGATEKPLGQKVLGFIQRITQPSSDDSLGRARQAIADEDYLAAFDFCIEALPDPWAFRSLLRCAEALGTEDHVAKAISVFSDAPKEVSETLRPQDRERLLRLSVSPTPSTQPRPESGWIEWANHVLAGPSDTVDLLSVLDRAITTWDVTEFSRSARQCDEFAKILVEARGTAEATFRDAFPSLVRFFVDGPIAPSRSLSPIYAALLKIIAWGGVASADELRLTAAILEAFVQTGPTAKAYEETLDDVHEIAVANRAPSIIDWTLEVSELLILNPSPATESRLRFFMEGLSVVQNWAHRLSTAQRTVFAMLASDYGCSEVLASLPMPTAIDDADADVNAARLQFSGLVGIYTLSEASGRRARELLKQLMPSARVDLNSDLVATEKLECLARSADIFAFAWKKSSHPAFYCAKGVRGDRELLMPSGGGAASIVRAVLAHVPSQ